MQKAMVSIIVPVYNLETKIEKCLYSILAQTFKAIEVIVVNDGSKDRSLSIIKRMALMDNRIRIIDKSNGGHISARFAGLEKVSADLCMFIDGDDWVHPEMVQRFFSVYSEHNAELVIGTTYNVLDRWGIIKKPFTSFYFQDKTTLFEGDSIRKTLSQAYLYGHPLPASLYAKLYKTSLLRSTGNFMDQIRFFGEDLIWNSEILLKAKKVILLQEPLYYYRCGGGTSKYMQFMFDDSLAIYQFQQHIISEHFQDSLEYQQAGVTIKFINTLLTCIENTFHANRGDQFVKNMILEFCECKDAIDFDLPQVKNFFSPELLHSIKNSNVEFLFENGKKSYRKRILKNKIIRLVS